MRPGTIARTMSPLTYADPTAPVLERAFINLIEVAKENWSFGNGEMQYAPAPG